MSTRPAHRGAPPGHVLCLVATLTAAMAAASVPGCHANPVTVGGDDAATRNAEAYRLSRQAQDAQRAGNPDRAVDLYSQAAQLQPNLPGVWNNLGVLHLEQKRYMDAVIAFKREADTVPDDPRPFENLGLAYHEAGLADDSMRYFEEALRRDPNRLSSLRGLARVARHSLAASDELAQHMRRALLLESDPGWRRIFEGERVRVANQLNVDAETAPKR